MQTGWRGALLRGFLQGERAHCHVGAVTGGPSSHELGVFSPAEMSNQYGEVGRHGGLDG